jgi:16S rRNA (guanine527-N7)-methyltransferase
VDDRVEDAQAWAAAAKRLADLTRRYELRSGADARLLDLLRLVAKDPISLTSVRAPGEAVERHVADSLAALSVDEVRAARTLCDVGSGGGFPGLVLAIALPGAHVTLVESTGRKAAFLERAARALGCANVTVVANRVEEWPEGSDSQDVVTGRAVAALPVVLEYAAPLLVQGGLMVAWKGPLAAGAEGEAAAAAAEQLNMSAPTRATPDEAQTDLYLSWKVGPTPARFPRRPGMARKRPLGAST